MPCAVSPLILSVLFIHVLALKTKFTSLEAMMEWLERMTSTATILIRIDGEKSRQMTCLLLRGIDIFRLFIQDRSSFLGAMMDSIESMISLNTTSTIILGKKFLHPMTMRCLQVHAILTQL